MTEQSPMKGAMDLLTMGYRTQVEVADQLGENIAKAAARQLDRDYGDDHIPWYAKRWRPLDATAQRRYDEKWPGRTM